MVHTARIPTDDLKPEYLQMTLSPRLCVVEIVTPRHFSFQRPINVVSFPQTIRDWNGLPDSLFSTAEMSDACVSKFTPLARSMD